VTYIESGDQLDLAHNFVFVHLPWDAQAIRASVEQFEELTRHTAWPAWFRANHDHPRSGPRRGKLAALLICTLRGTPFIYQGEELGLPDAEIPPEAVVDVDGRDPERAPIPWSRPSEAGPGAGFTSGEPWLPLPGDPEHLSVSAQLEDPSSTLHFVRRLIELRAREPALQGGAQRSVDADPAVFCFTRERFLVALNFTSEPAPLAPREELPARARLELSTNPAREPGDVEPAALVLEPDEGVVLNLAS
jgi:alpha-glucosidase